MSTTDAFVTSSSAGLVRPKPGFLALGVIAALLGVGVLGTVAVTGVLPLLAILLHCVLFGTMAFRYAFNSTSNANVHAGTLRVDRNQQLLFKRQDNLGGERTIAHRSDLAQGFVVPTAEGTLVRLDRKGMKPPIFVRVRDDDEGVSLLRALGFDAEHVAAEMKIATGLAAMGLGKQMLLMFTPVVLFIPAFLATVAAFKHDPSGPVLGLTAILLTYVFTLSFSRTAVRVGTDGIFTKWLGRERFIPFSQIKTAHVYDEVVSTKRQHGVRLTLNSGEKIRLPTGQTDIGSGDAERLNHRIGEAITARNAGAVQPAHALDRGGKSLVEWVRDLKRIGAGVVDHRTPAVPIDVLLRVVEDSAADAADRASAALAAISYASPDAKRRVRVAAEATASPHLRVALTRIAESDDDEALASVLDDLEKEDRQLTQMR